jgi:hypothetical protein
MRKLYLFTSAWIVEVLSPPSVALFEIITDNAMEKNGAIE